MSDPIDSATAVEHDRQERAFEHAHRCMDFVGSVPLPAEGPGLAEVLGALDRVLNVLDIAAIDEAERILAAFQGETDGT